MNERKSDYLYYYIMKEPDFFFTSDVNQIPYFYYNRNKPPNDETDVIVLVDTDGSKVVKKPTADIE